MAVASLALGFIVMALWNALIPALFKGPAVTFWQAVGLLLLSHILLRGWGHGHHSHGWRRDRRKQRFEEKLAAMAPEEREKFKAEWRTPRRLAARGITRKKLKIMTMTPGLRKFALTVHLTFSIGWIGAVVAFLALVVAAMTSQDAQTLRAAWIAMELTGWFAIVPLALASLLTGLVMSLGTKWGLFRHYWVLFSLVLTIVAAVVLLQHMQTVNFFAGVAAETDSADVGGLRDGLRGELLHAGVGLLVLLVIQVLNMYKPQGMTPYGWRKQHEQQKGMPDRGLTTRKSWGRYVLFVLIGLVLLFVILHLIGGGLHH